MSRFRVQLRNGGLAVVCDLDDGTRDAEPVGVFVWLAFGRTRPCGAAGQLGAATEGYPVADMWRRDGRWREDGTDHPLDIVSGLEEVT